MLKNTVRIAYVGRMEVENCNDRQECVEGWLNTFLIHLDKPIEIEQDMLIAPAELTHDEPTIDHFISFFQIGVCSARINIAEEIQAFFPCIREDLRDRLKDSLEKFSNKLPKKLIENLPKLSYKSIYLELYHDEDVHPSTGEIFHCDMKINILLQERIGDVGKFMRSLARKLSR